MKKTLIFTFGDHFISTCKFDQAVLVLGEIGYWSQLRLKGLIEMNPMEPQDLQYFSYYSFIFQTTDKPI